DAIPPGGADAKIASPASASASAATIGVIRNRRANEDVAASTDTFRNRPGVTFPAAFTPALLVGARGAGTPVTIACVSNLGLGRPTGGTLMYSELIQLGDLMIAANKELRSEAATLRVYADAVRSEAVDLRAHANAARRRACRFRPMSGASDVRDDHVRRVSLN